jgi:hypothetical protein
MGLAMAVIVPGYGKLQDKFPGLETLRSLPCSREKLHQSALEADPQHLPGKIKNANRKIPENFWHKFLPGFRSCCGIKS